VTKYNAKKKEVDGIKFDSIAESQYYLHLKEQAEKGHIKAFSLQPTFTLQESFKKDGRAYRKIEYRADFEVIHQDESIEIVDVKGMMTSDFKIKMKLFQKKYPYRLSLMKFVKKYGGWIEYHDWKKRKKEEKKVKK
jgi:hypothetical protein